MDEGVRLHHNEGIFAKNRAKQRVGSVGQGSGRTPDQGISGVGPQPKVCREPHPAVRVNWTCAIRMNPPLGMKTPIDSCPGGSRGIVTFTPEGILPFASAVNVPMYMPGGVSSRSPV